MSYESTVSGSETELCLWKGKWLGNVLEDKDYVYEVPFLQSKWRSVQTNIYFDSYVKFPSVTDSEDLGLEDDEGCVCDTLLDGKLKFKTIPGLGRHPQMIKLHSLQYKFADFEFEPPRPATPSETSDKIQLDQELGSTKQDLEDEERCICVTWSLLNNRANVAAYCSPDTILTEDQIDFLDEFIVRFKKVNVPEKTNIIQEAANAIKHNWE